jgi:transcriptional regulator with PAS, ATPase and Fis domain
LQESIQHTREKRDEQFNQLYETVYQGMFNPAGVLPCIDRSLDKELALKHKKKEALYKEWKEQVYDHIHDQLQDKVDGLSAEAINKKLNANYEAFLKISAKKCSQNHRGGVFRDVIIQSDYDPLAPLQSTMKVRISNLLHHVLSTP